MEIDSPYWKAFNIFLNKLAILMHDASSKVKAWALDDFDAAIAEWNMRKSRIPERKHIGRRMRNWKNCFESVRISANIAPKPLLLSTSHESTIASLYVTGNFTEGYLKSIKDDVPILYYTPSGCNVVMTTNIPIGNIPFVGKRRYQIELFLPETRCLDE